MNQNDTAPETDEPDLDGEAAEFDGPLIPEPPHPINWNLLTSEEAEAEWLELNRWVDWLRRTYGLPASVVPPFWHRHPELLWELSALHLHWLSAYDPEQNGSAPLGWHRDFADARQRLRDWVAASGTRLDRDRPTRITPWPGGEAEDWAEQDTAETPVTARSSDFLAFVEEQVKARQQEQAATIQEIVNTDWSDRP